METVTTTVEIAGPTGHEALELTQDQTMALVGERRHLGIFPGRRRYDDHPAACRS